MIKNLSKLIFLFIGTISVPVVNAASYTHRLNYNHIDNGTNATLYAYVTFETTGNNAQINFDGNIDRTFITAVTYYYQPSTGGTTYVVGTSDITKYIMVHDSPGNTDYDFDPTLFSQINATNSRLQFSNDHINGATGEFFLNMGPSSGSQLQAQISGGITNDFELASTQMPAPLPLLGIIPAFSSILKLKKRYNSKGIK